MNRSIRETRPSNPRTRTARPFRESAWALLTLGGAIVIGVVAGDVRAQSDDDANQSRRTYRMPSVSPSEFVEDGTNVIRSWEDEALVLASDRTRLYEKIGEVLVRYDEFQERVGKVYPQDQLEWLLVTDSVADTLSDALENVIDGYRDAYADEILTEGRQAFEKAMMQIVGAPPRVLGFHVAMLADYAYEKADSLLALTSTTDKAGVRDGVLRNLADWTALWQQVHSDPLTIYESRLAQEDWIIVRIKDKCGNVGKWRITDQYMAMVGYDSTKTPPTEQFAHEFHLKGTECDDERVIHVDLPNFQEMQMYVLEKQGGGGPGQP